MTNLNEQQEAAASHIDGPCLVVSVPGSGKTRILVERTARLIESGVPAGNIICVTFTNKAANEMRSRVCDRLDIDRPSCFVGTFHKLCVSLLRKFGDRIGYNSKFTIIDSGEQSDLVRQYAKHLEIEIDRGEASVVAGVLNNWRENDWSRRDFENKMVELGHADLIPVADNYLERMLANNMIDFSGLLSETMRLCEEEPDVLERIQNKCRYLLVDETQDTNYAQFYLIKQFSAKNNNVFLVGDVSQSIYKFRGARHQNIKDFIASNDDCKVLELSLNYRSTPEIVEKADFLIRRNASHMAKEFKTNNPSGEEPRCLQMMDDRQEADFIAGQIRRLRDGGWDYGDIAILYRMNRMSEPLERAMANSSIPYKVIGGRSFFDRREIKDCLAMLRFAVNPRDTAAFHRVADLMQGVGDKTIGDIEVFSLEKDLSILDACKEFPKHTTRKAAQVACGRISTFFDDVDTMSASNAMSQLVDNFEYEDFLDRQYKKDAESSDRWSNVAQIIDSAASFEEQHDDGGISRYLQSIALLSSSDDESDEDHVSLMTIHASKGLEFPVIFMVRVEADVLPHSMSVKEDPIGGVEEERRLCYVGMTRAEKLLYMTYCKEQLVFRKKRGGGSSLERKKCSPSQFLYESMLLERK